MAYLYSVRGWMELSWPDSEFEGVDETAEQHVEKVRRIRELLKTDLTAEQLTDESIPVKERYKAGWCFPQRDLGGTEYLFYGADVEEPPIVVELIKEILAIDTFADGYFSVEGEDGEHYRQWLVLSGKIYARRQLFPDFDVDKAPQGYSPLLFSPSSNSIS